MAKENNSKTTNHFYNNTQAIDRRRYIVGKTTIKRYLREKKETKEVYIPLVYRAGEVAQVDYFEVAVKIKEEEKKYGSF
ncbi:MAG: hypothetical protein IPK14_08350 [Blastocatellia bacterium]|nr:hypothetical protein [Blastocatellia bacterium]